MKRYAFYVLWTILVLIFRSTAFSQLVGVTLPLSPERKIRYQQVVEMEDSTITRQKLFECLRKWCVTAFVDSKEAIQIEDANIGTLNGKSSFVVEVQGGISVTCIDRWRFEFLLEAKQGRYRYTFEGFKFGSQNVGTKTWDGYPAEWFYFNESKPYFKMFTKMLVQLNDNMVDIVSTLNRSMIKCTKQTVESDW